MKKALCLVLAGFILLSGCQSNKNITDEITISETTTQTEEQLQVMATTTVPQTTTSQTTPTQTTTQETTVTTTEPPTPTTQTIATTIQTAPTQTSTTKATTAPKPTETTIIETEVKEIEVIEGLPEIVFINLNCVCVSEFNLVYGHYIDNKGVLRYFELYDDTEAAFARKGEFRWTYFKNFYKKDYGNNLIKEKYDEIIKVSVETEMRVDKDKLIEYYNELQNVDINSEIKVSSPSTLDINPNVSQYYGIRIGKKNEIEIIILASCSLGPIENMDKSAQVLFEEMYALFPMLRDEYAVSLYEREKNIT